MGCNAATFMMLTFFPFAIVVITLLMSTLIRHFVNSPSRCLVQWTIRELQKGLNRRTSEIFECMGFQW